MDFQGIAWFPSLVFIYGYNLKKVSSPLKRNWLFATTSNFLVSTSLQPVGINLWYFKLKLFDFSEFIIWNI